MNCKYCNRVFELDHIHFRHEQAHCHKRPDTVWKYEDHLDVMKPVYLLHKEHTCNKAELLHLHGLLILLKNKNPFLRFECTDCKERFLWERELIAHKDECLKTH